MFSLLCTGRGTYLSAFVAGFAIGSLLARHLPMVRAVRVPRKRKGIDTGFSRHLDPKGWTHWGMQITDEELRDAEPFFPLEPNAKRILRVNPTTVVKMGANLNMTEVDNIEFIRAHTTIPVPRIMNAYHKKGFEYIVMEYIDGEQLEVAWATLSPEQKDDICAELHDYISQMRKIPPPGNYIGSVTGGRIVDRRNSRVVFGGPFNGEEEFNQWQLSQVHDDVALCNREVYARMHRTDHRIVFSHCDLGFHNILVKDGRIAAILDWEDAGWFPEHWDYCKSQQFFAGIDELFKFCCRAYGRQYPSEHLMDTWFLREVKTAIW